MLIGIQKDKRNKQLESEMVSAISSYKALVEHEESRAFEFIKRF